MALLVPLQATASQTLTITLGDQNCQLNVYQKSTGLFMDVISNGELVQGGVLCENLNRIVRSAYLGFSGDFEFLDTQGTSDPSYSGLGSQFLLFYLTEADLAAGVVSGG